MIMFSSGTDNSDLTATIYETLRESVVVATTAEKEAGKITDQFILLKNIILN